MQRRPHTCLSTPCFACLRPKFKYEKELFVLERSVEVSTLDYKTLPSDDDDIKARTASGGLFEDCKSAASGVIKRVAFERLRKDGYRCSTAFDGNCPAGSVRGMNFTSMCEKGSCTKGADASCDTQPGCKDASCYCTGSLCILKSCNSADACCEKVRPLLPWCPLAGRSCVNVAG